MKAIDYLKLFCEQTGPTGFERPVSYLAAKEIGAFVDEVKVDRLANVIAVRYADPAICQPKGVLNCHPGGKARRISTKNHRPSMLIAAHLDEVGLMVCGHEDGFLCVTQVGGLDQRVLPGKELIIMTDPPRLGVVSVQPPHVLKSEDMDKAIPLGEIRVDAGMSQKEAEKKIPIGTPITYKTKGYRIGKNRYISKTLDDRACFAILLMAAEMLKDEKLPWDVYFVGSTGEERAEGGAPSAVFETNADVCIAIDVTQATTPDANPAIHAGIYTQELGKGAVLSRGPNITKWVGKGLEQAAKDNDIPVQICARPGRTGTDAWSMHIVREGVASALIELPLRYMHSPTECVDLRDMESCAKLVAAYAKAGPGKEALL